MFSRISPKHPKATRAAFTLTELLVVVAVVVALALLAFWSFQSAMRSSKTAGSLANLKQLTGALLNFATDNNNMFPNCLDPVTQAQSYSYDVQLLPYLGINEGHSGSPSSPNLRPGLGLDVFRCPLDPRKSSPSDAFYPRSYGITTVTVCAPKPNGGAATGGISGRRKGEGLRLLRLRSPAKFVILCRYEKSWEDYSNFSKVGSTARSVNDGPEAEDAMRWDAYHPEFGGKTPYGFADGHVALLNRQESLAIKPFRYDVNK